MLGVDPDARALQQPREGTRTDRGRARARRRSLRGRLALRAREAGRARARCTGVRATRRLGRRAVACRSPASSGSTRDRCRSAGRGARARPRALRADVPRRLAGARSRGIRHLPSISRGGHARRSARGLRLELLDIGGGLPARYTEPVPGLEEFGRVISEAVARLPYPVEVVAEPGRALVAEAGVLATTVIGVAERHGRRWVHLDCGAFNGMMESLETRRELIFPLAWSQRGRRRLVPAPSPARPATARTRSSSTSPLPDDLGPGIGSTSRPPARTRLPTRLASTASTCRARTSCRPARRRSADELA